MGERRQSGMGRRVLSLTTLIGTENMCVNKFVYGSMTDRAGPKHPDRAELDHEDPCYGDGRCPRAVEHVYENQVQYHKRGGMNAFFW